MTDRMPIMPAMSSDLDVEVKAPDWVVDALYRVGIHDLSEGQARCFRVLCSWSAPYNLPLIGNGWAGAIPRFDSDAFEDDGPPVRAPINVTSHSVIARIRNELATFDGSELTQLVVAAHQYAVRVSISAEIYEAVDTESYVTEWVKPGRWEETGEHPRYPAPCLTIRLHPRQHEGSNWVRHPTVEHLAHYATRHAS